MRLCWRSPCQKILEIWLLSSSRSKLACKDRASDPSRFCNPLRRRPEGGRNQPALDRRTGRCAFSAAGVAVVTGSMRIQTNSGIDRFLKEGYLGRVMEFHV